jgi:hypothetical protein
VRFNEKERNKQINMKELEIVGKRMIDEEKQKTRVSKQGTVR